MKLQTKVLKAILSGKVELFDNIESQWFYDKVSSLLFDVLFYTWKINNNINESLVKTLVHASTESDKTKRALLFRLNQVSASDLIVSGGMDVALKKEWKQYEAQRLKDHFLDKDSTVESQIEKTNQFIDKMNGATDDTQLYNFQECVNEMFRSYEKGDNTEYQKNTIVLQNRDLASLFPFGKLFPEIYTIASRPGMRKTNTLNNIQVAINEQKVSAIYFSMEDHKDKTVNKLLSIKNRYHLSDLMQLKIDKCTEFKKNTGDPTKNRLWIDNTRYDPDKFGLAVEKYINKYNVKIVYLDHMGLARYQSRNSRTENIGEMMNIQMELKNKYNIPFINTSQVRRQTEEKMVTVNLNDLSDSKSIEETSRYVVALNGYRESDARVWNVLKNDCGSLYQKKIKYELHSGLITSVYNFEDGDVI